VLEEWTARRLRDRGELFGVGLQLGSQSIGRRVGEFGGVRFHYDKKRLGALRERVVHRMVERGPSFVRLYEAADVGIELEMVRDIVAAQNGKHERDHDDMHRTAYRQGDDTDDRRLQMVGDIRPPSPLVGEF